MEEGRDLEGDCGQALWAFRGYRHFRGYAELFGSKDEQIFQIVEEIMLVLSHDKHTLFAELENLSAKSFKKNHDSRYPRKKIAKLHSFLK